MIRKQPDTLSARLVRVDWLDPREAAEAVAEPIVGAVNIPFSELGGRVGELPPADEEIGIVGPAELARRVIVWLAERGRRSNWITTRSLSPTRKLDGSQIGRLWRPNAFLEEVIPQLKPGRALDLACGTGREAVYLAANGWDVTAVDVLPDALERAEALERRYLRGPQRIRWVQCNLEKEPQRVESTYDLITIFRYLNRPLVGILKSWLSPGGSVICETFTTLHRERHGRPSCPANVLKHGELPTLFPEFTTRHHSEDWRGAAHTARLWTNLRTDEVMSSNTHR